MTCRCDLHVLQLYLAGSDIEKFEKWQQCKGKLFAQCDCCQELTVDLHCLTDMKSLTQDVV